MKRELRIGTKPILVAALLATLTFVACFLMLPWIGMNANRILGKPYTISSSREHARARGVLVATASTNTLEKRDGIELTEAWVESNSVANNENTYLCFRLNQQTLGLGVKLERKDGSHEIVPTANRGHTLALFLTRTPTSLDDISVDYFDGGELRSNTTIVFYLRNRGASLDENELSTDNQILKLILTELNH